MRTLGKIIFSAGCFGTALVILATCARAEGTGPATPVAQPGVSVSITQQDGANLTQVCNIAIDGAKDLGTKTGIGQFCLGLLGKIGEAQRNAAKSATVPATSAAPSAPSAVPPAPKSGEKQ